MRCDIHLFPQPNNTAGYQALSLPLQNDLCNPDTFFHNMKKFGTFGRKLKAHKSEMDKLEANPQPQLAPKKSFTSLRRKLKSRHYMDDIPAGFTFLPLNMAPGARSFRLLKLLPGDELDIDIRCEMFHSSLDEKPAYEALSYAWDRENPKKLIYLHGRVRPVTTDLYQALTHLRLHDRIRILWISVLCSNQEDIIEKTHQVPLIRNIYRC